MYTLHKYELDPINGHLYLDGRCIGTLTNQGYIEARVGKGKRAKVHRMIYEWVHGSIPDGMVIDHIDGNRANNVPWNLQAITNRENTTRTKRPTSGEHHICIMPNGKYRVQIKRLGKSVRFDSLEKAIAHRDSLLELI